VCVPSNLKCPPAASGLVTLVLPCSSLTRASLCCCCRAVALWLRSPCSLTFSLRAHHDAPPRTPPHRPSSDLWHLTRFLCASHGFLCALCAAGALYWPDCLAYDLPIAFAHALLCAAWLFLQRRLCAHLPHWRVLRWRLCYECFLLPCDGVHCCRIERAAAVLLECVHAGGERGRVLFECNWDSRRFQLTNGCSRRVECRLCRRPRQCTALSRVHSIGGRLVSCGYWNRGCVRRWQRRSS
jgi:hypothetical protein